jgi:predicted dinucleotide-binding enzyme
MQIGILGSGEVGQKLADGFIAIGYTVKIETRSPEKVAPRTAKLGGKASIGCFSDAATFGEIVVLATYWEGTPSALQLARVKNLSGMSRSTTTG